MALVTATLGAGILSAAPAHAIANGAVVSADALRFVAKIAVGEPGQPGSTACTGALIDPSWVITASTCFGNNVAAGPPKLDTTVTVGRLDLTEKAGHELRVVELVPHPDRNVVLARLSETVTDVTPVKLAAAQPSAGDTLTVAGFGRTHEEWVPDKLHTGAFTVTTAGAKTFDITSEASTICKGDSGGPVLRQGAAGPELVALNHTSGQAGCYGSATTQRGAVETRVGDLGAWISDAAKAPRRLWQKQSLTKGQFLESPDGRFELRMGTDGNLAVIERKVGALWQSNTTDGAQLDYQEDGNLVLHRADKSTPWASGTNGSVPGVLSVENDGNVVLRRLSDNGQIWSFGTGGHFAPPPQPAAQTNKLTSGQAIWRGGMKLTSPDGRFWLTLQESDGNLVVYQGPQWLYANGKYGAGAWAIVQDDGNFVVRDSKGGAIWASGSWGNGASTLTMQDDGNLVLRRNSDKVITWTSKTCCHPVPPTQAANGSDRLMPGQGLFRDGAVLKSPDGRFHLQLQASDGNFVLYKDNVGARWASSSFGSAAFAVNQSDGNLVVYDVNNALMWSSNTSDNGPSTLVLGNDGVLALRRNSDNVVTWSSGKVPPPQPSAQTDKLTSGQAIWRGSMSLKSADGKNSLTLQDSDGNLVVRQGLAALWATGKFGSDIGWATVQEDGNFVVYNDKGEWQWASGTDGNGPSTLTMQNDGNLVLTRNSDGAETWSWRSGKH